MLYAENLKVYSDYAIDGILDIEFTVGKGEHGKLILRGHLFGEENFPPVEGTVRVTGTEDGGKEETLFFGNILESHIFVENGVRQVILAAESIDEVMDRTKRSRSFQNPKLTHAQIIREVLAEYGGTLRCEIPSVKIGTPVLQYEETDWEFCKRMAGNMGLGVFSGVESTHPQIIAGPAEGKKAEFPEDSYLFGIDECYYLEGKKQGATKREFLYYQVSTEQHCKIGDYAKYKGRKLYIYHIKAELKNEELVFTYKLGEKCHFLGTQLPNRKVAGVTLYGRVERTEGESVYLKLEIDGKNGKAVYPFAWAPPTGNLAYCMPRVGTRACLYVPDCYGQRAIVVGNARTNGGASCFNDVQSRGLVTEHGKQLLLHADALGLTDGCHQTVLGVDRLCLQAGEGKCMLRATEGIYIQGSSVTVRTPLAVNQYRTGEEGKGKKNPATGGEKTSIQSQYEFSISSPLGELIGTEYENYNHFENEIQYESYRAVEIRRLDGLLKGIATAVAIGALVTAVALTGGAALGVALAVGAVVAGVGCAASAVTYMRDRENNTASSSWTYIRNSGIASLITASVIAMFWAAPYAAEAVTLEVTHGMPLVMLFGKVFAYEELVDLALIGTQGAALLNTFFQVNELGMFFADTKDFGEPTGFEAYDEMKQLTEAYCFMLFFMGVSNWLQNKQAKNPSVTESEPEPEKPVESAGAGEGGISSERIEFYLSQARNNTSSDTVILGRTGQYDVIAESEGYTYFKMEDELWNSLVEEVGQDYDEIWRINQQFLDEQIALGKNILLTNDPYAEYYFPDGSPQFYQRELDYLSEAGYIFEKIIEGIWKAIRK